MQDASHHESYPWRIHGTNGLFTYIDPQHKSTIHVGTDVPCMSCFLNKDTYSPHCVVGFLDHFFFVGGLSWFSRINWINPFGSAGSTHLNQLDQPIWITWMTPQFHDFQENQRSLDEQNLGAGSQGSHETPWQSPRNRYAELRAFMGITFFVCPL